MKVLMINVVCGVKSTGRICTDFAEALEKQGHIVRIAYGREMVPDQYQRYAVRIGNDIDVLFHAGLSRLFDTAGFHSRFCTKRFIDWIQKYNPDVIHIHNIHGYYINVEMLFSYLKVCNKRIIWTLHDCWPVTGHSALCDGDNCEKWKIGCERCPQKNIYPKSMIDRSRRNWLIKQKLFTGIPNCTILVPSQWLANNVRMSFLKEYPVSVINNGIDTSVFKSSDGGSFRKDLGIEDKIVILGVASSWKYKKGFYDFLKLCDLLDDNYRIVLIGVEEKLRLEKRPNLITIGMTRNLQELVDAYSAADVFVNLSYCDTYPTVNLEAIACDTPVITYDTGGCAETIYDYGVVVNKGDLYKIVEAIHDYKKIKRTTIDKAILDKATFVRKYLKYYEM